MSLHLDLAQSSASDVTRPQVLHVTESLAGGVLAAIKDYVRNTSAADHHLLYCERSDAPLHAGDLATFTSSQTLPEGLKARVQAVRQARSKMPRHVVVHAHSSFAGVYARTALIATKHTKIVYTPHCYAFERRDVSRAERVGYRLVEALLSLNTSYFAACSPRERALSRFPWSKAKTVLLPNVGPVVTEPIGAQASTPTVVVGSGRNGAQKDPDFFAQCIGSLRDDGHEVKAVWIGGDEALQQSFAHAKIDVTGWLPREESLKQLASADLYIHSASWEGFPVALLEVAAIGVPAAVRQIPAFEGMNLPFAFASPGELATRWNEYATSQQREGLARALRVAVASNTDEAQTEVLRNLYDMNEAIS